MVAADVESALQQLFKAYDLDESGELSRDEFIAIEMRISLETGAAYRSDAGSAKATLTDRDSSGFIDYDEFRTRFLTGYQAEGLTKAQIIAEINKQSTIALTERARMGPRFHAGIRAMCRQIFDLFDVSGDGFLSPEEWISAQKTIALEVSDDLDEGWVDEAAFNAADTNGDGQLDLMEFLESSFSMFEGVKKGAAEILATLQRIAKAMEKENAEGKKTTLPVTVLVQAADKPEFEAPMSAWQDAPTEDAPEKNADKWKNAGQISLPLNMETAEDVTSLLRLMLHLPADQLLSVFYRGPPREEGQRPVTLLRGGKAGEGNTQSMLQYLAKPGAEGRLYVKNLRKRTTKLTLQQRVFDEEREALLAKRQGQCWGLDWETQLVGEGSPLPPRHLMIASVGDALVVEVPETSGGGEYRFSAKAYMDGNEVLSQPVNEVIEPKKSKKKKKAAEGEPDNMLQLTFVALKEGKCIMFVDVSWEDQEEKLAMAQKLAGPVPDNSVARIGPIEVEVKKVVGKVEPGLFMWWNGEKWTPKKGPAKKKKGPKK